jgi:hypothetical protein
LDALTGRIAWRFHGASRRYFLRGAETSMRSCLLVLLALLVACSETPPAPSGPTDANGDTEVSATLDGASPDDGATSDVTATSDGDDGASSDRSSPDGSTTDGNTTDGSTTDGSTTDGAPVDASRDATADVAPDAPERDEVVALVVAPAMATVRVTAPGMRPTTPFTVTGRTRLGRTVPVTALWSTTPAALATAAPDGTVTATGVAGGDVIVTARSGTLAASATLRIVIDVTVTAGPADTGALFPAGATPTVDAMRTPGWIYPANETVFPQNLNRVLFQWRPAGNNRFRITFESDRTRVVVLTDGANTTCARAAAATALSCFEPELAVWRYLAASNPRGSVRITVDGALASAPGRFYRSATLTVGFSRGPVPGAIYYWSTTARGVRRGNLEEAVPRNFLTPPEASNECVACHTLSRRGNRLAADVGGNVLWIVEVSPTTPPPRLVTQYERRDIPMFWSTFSPDESRIVAAARGVMTLRRTSDGGPINTIALGARTFGTQPDWAPDNALLAYTQSADDRDRGVRGGRIAAVDVRPGDAWGTPRLLHGTGANNDTNQFPSFSWDSQWIAFAHSTGSGQNDVTSDLWLVRRDGTSARALTRANTVINNGVITTPTVQDNMPTWAPTGAPDDYAWVAFSSTRDYGAVLGGTSRLGRHEQVWVAAVDLTRAAAEDASYPAFRLPCQDLDEDTHRPFWALDRVRMACAASGATCMLDGDCCAPLTCAGGVCRTACAPLAATCTTSADCCAPQVCLGGVCRTPCGPAGAGCATSAECCVPGTCMSGVCTTPPCRTAGTACTTSADCCAPSTCVGGICTPPVCRGAGAACTMATDCCAPLACTAGMCRAACRTAGSACAADGDCCTPATCRGGVCATPCRTTGSMCTSDADCCSPGACRGGMCAAPCRAAGATCTTSADCCAPNTCEGGVCRGACVMTGGACASDTDCCTGQTCSGGACRPPCRATAAACTTNADCCSGTCTRGACAPPPCRVTGQSCATSADCCSGTCVSGGCAPG